MEKKIVELVIGETGLDNLGVDAIALVENPAIEENFLYFKEEKFVEPKAGESEGDFIGRCMSAIEGEFPDQDQRLAVCYSYWEGSEEFQDEMNLDVLGYATKNFEICPGAINTFKRLVELGAGDEDLEGMIRSAALQADAVFGMEKKVIADGTATKEDLYQATIIVADFMDLVKEIGEQIGEEFPVDYMMGHLEVIGNLIPDEEFDFDPSALPQYVDEITEDDKKKVDELIIKVAEKRGFGYDFANAAVIPGRETDEQIIEYLDLGNTKGRTVYKYYPETVGNTSRDFCREMVGLDKYYTYADLKAMENVAVNPGFGRDGASTYSIWKYKGGPRCKHYWRKFYVTLKDGVVRFEDKGKAQGDAGTKPESMPLEGYVSEESRRKSEIGYITSLQASQELECECGCESNDYHFNEDQRIVTGPAMVPDYEMVRRAEDGSKYWVYFTEETIRDIAEKFMREKRLDSTNLEHDSDDPRPNNYVYESWIIEDPEMDKAKAMGFNLPKGTWMVSMRVGDDYTWKLIKQGKIKGFSVEGFFGEMIQKS